MDGVTLRWSVPVRNSCHKTTTHLEMEQQHVETVRTAWRWSTSKVANIPSDFPQCFSPHFAWDTTLATLIGTASLSFVQAIKKVTESDSPGVDKETNVTWQNIAFGYAWREGLYNWSLCRAWSSLIGRPSRNSKANWAVKKENIGGIDHLRVN